MNKDNYIWIGLIALLAIIIIGPQTGLFGVITLSEKSLNETEDCPDWAKGEIPCTGANWIDKPNCFWDISNCKDYCDSDEDCIIYLDVPNDCTTDWKPSKVKQLGYCKYNFCQWQTVPELDYKECTGFQLFLQKYPYFYYVVGALAIIAILIIFEVDWKGKRRGFF